MKRSLFILPTISMFLLSGCGQTKLLNTTANPSVKTGAIVQENKKNYVVKNVRLPDQNGEQIDVYLDSKLVFSKAPQDGLGFFYKLVDNVIFIDYGTAVGGRTIKLFDLNNGRQIFETRYNGELKIEGNTLYYNFSFYPEPKGVTCSNYEEIKNMGGSVNYEQKKSYNFKTNQINSIGDIYCAYGE